MAQDLLSLVDTLMGNVLAGNVFSNVRQYSDYLNADRSGLYQQGGAPPSVLKQQETISKLPPPASTLPGKLDLMSRDDLASKFDANKFGPGANQNSFVSQNSTETFPQPIGLMDGKYRMGNQYTEDNKFSIPSYGLLKTLDIFAISNWMKNVGKQVYFGASNNNDPITRQADAGIPGEVVAKSTAWLASQFLLASLNSGDFNSYGVSNMIWNPLSFFATAAPGARGLSIAGVSPTGITIGATGLFGDYKTNVQALAIGGLDKLSLIREGLYTETSPVHRLTKLKSPVATPGFFGDLSKAGEIDTLEQEQFPLFAKSVGAQVDGGLLGQVAQKIGLHTNPYTSENPYTPNSAVKPLKDLESLAIVPGDEKLSALFTPTQFPGGVKTGFGPTAYNFVAKVNPLIDMVKATDNADSPGVNASTTALDANFLDEDPTTNVVNGEPIAESDIYMPFMFQDLRDGQAPNEQFLYFRAFLKGDLTETFTPDWQTERYYGRVDEIPTYLGTSRTINFSFDIVAWKAADLYTIYTKLHKLQSMAYPSYTAGGFMNAAPIIRLRIGDLIAGFNNRGIPGYITSMDLSYDDGIWNIQQDFKVPRKIAVSISYVVLHDGNPGIYPYSQKTVNADGTVTGGDATTTFGAGKFARNPDGSFTATVSVRDLRKIFGTVRNIAT